MPDLSNKSIHKFWREHPDPLVYKTIVFMEGVEDWTHDGDQSLENALKNLGETLDKTGNVDFQDEDQFIKISTGIKTGRALRLLQCFDIAHPGAAAKLLIHAEENIEAQNTNNEMFLQRNIVFERLRLFSRIFSKSRLDSVLKASGGEKTND